MKSLPVVASPSVIASQAKQSRSSRRNASRDEAGFGLLELMLAATIAAGVTLGYLYNQSRQSAINQAQSQAGYYQMVSDAVAKYMATNYDQLKAIPKPKTCSAPQLFTEATAATAPTGCGINALFLSGSASSPVANGLQPTLTELKNTGYLDGNFSNSFLWPTQLTMYAASGVSSGSSYAAPEYRVQIQPWCNGVAPSTDTVCEKPVLHSLVYNAQPFAANTNNSFVNLTRLDSLMQARTTLGANAFVSYDWALQKDGLMYSDGNKNQLPNLLTFSSGSNSGVGLEGVLALQGWFTPSSQTVGNTQSPSSPPPTASPAFAEALPFSGCDPQKDTVAVAKFTIARIVPSQKLINNTCTQVLFERSGMPNWIGGFMYPAYMGGALTCKENTRATSHIAECPPPEDWPMCTTKPTDKFATAPSKDGEDANKPWCWQPVSENFVARVPPQRSDGFKHGGHYFGNIKTQDTNFEYGVTTLLMNIAHSTPNALTTYAFPWYVFKLQWGNPSYSTSLLQCTNSKKHNIGCYFYNFGPPK
jgi:hypothetical protein